MTFDSVKFSIITVTYNAGQWLERTVLNVLSQSYPVEYIVVDGGSTDQTADIIRQYASGITYWVSEPDHGLYDAMNKGLQRATGNYVLFLNAGDTLYTLDTLKQIADRITNRTPWPDVIYGETMIVDKQNQPRGLRRLKIPKELTWKSFRMGMLVCHQSFIVKRDIAPLYDLSYRWVADYDWCIRCLQKAVHVQNAHRVITNFMEDGLSSAHRKDSLKERYAVMKIYYGQWSVIILHLWFALRFGYAKWIRRRI